MRTEPASVAEVRTGVRAGAGAEGAVDEPEHLGPAVGEAANCAAFISLNLSALDGSLGRRVRG